MLLSRVWRGCKILFLKPFVQVNIKWHKSRRWPIPSAALHWPEPPQPDHDKEWPKMPVQTWCNDLNLQNIDSLIHITKIYSDDTDCHSGLTSVAKIISKWGQMITAEGVGPPESNKADFQDGESNGNHEDAARKSATAKYLQMKSAEWSQQDLSHHRLHPVRQWIPCWYCNLAKGWDKSQGYQEKELPHYARRFPNQVQHLEAVQKLEPRRPRN